MFSHKSGARVAAVHHGFASLCKRAGIKDFRIHDIRHTCASWLVSGAVPLRVVQEMLGHSSIQMTERYAHLAPENLKAVVHVLDRSHDLVTLGGLDSGRDVASKCLNLMVGVRGFEPPASTSRTWRSTRLSYTPNQTVPGAGAANYSEN